MSGLQFVEWKIPPSYLQLIEPAPPPGSEDPHELDWERNP